MNEWKIITIAHGCRYSLIFVEYKKLYCQINLQIVSPIRQFRFIIYDEGLNFIKKTTQVFFENIAKFLRTPISKNFCERLLLWWDDYWDFHHLNPFAPNGPLLYSLKTSENLRVFWCFQGVEKGCIRSEWIKLWLFTNGFMRWNCNYNYTMVCNTSW